jgi:hypothetical protein
MSRKCYFGYLVEKELLPLTGSVNSMFAGNYALIGAEKLKWDDKKYR